MPKKKLKQKPIKVYKGKDGFDVVIIKCVKCGRAIQGSPEIDNICVNCNYGKKGTSGVLKDLKELVTHKVGYRLIKGFNLLNKEA